MSIRAVEAAILTDAPTASAKAVMVALGYSHNQETGLCFPGRQRLAKLSGLKERTIYDAIKALVDAGLIEVERRYRSDGTRTSDGYRLLFATPDAIRERIREDEEAAAKSATEDALPADFAKTDDELTGGFRENSEGLVAPAAKTFAAGATQERGRERDKDPDRYRDQAVKIAEKVWPHVAGEWRVDDEKAPFVRAIGVALADQESTENLTEGLIRYYEIKARVGGRKGPKRPAYAVKDRAWEYFPPDDVHPRTGTPETKTDPPMPVDPEIGTLEQPGPRLQARWMRGWSETLPSNRPNYWQESWGPPPGAQGCRVSPAILAEYGVEVAR